MDVQKIENLVKKYRLESPVYVTRPRMPKFEDYVGHLKSIWQTGWLTNNGPFHIAFEKRLQAYLDVQHLNLFNNATNALLVALKSLNISDGEVITTPFTFPATVHVLWWNHLTPVFCDIEEKTFNIDPKKIENLITPQTKAILPVHVYGNPCDVEAIQKIADKHNLKIIYDAAHAFGVKINDVPVIKYGDISALSFHATKLFNTIEGGALISQSCQQSEKIYFLKNFGIAGEEMVIGPGINGKMNEFQAAFGLLELDIVDDEIQKRKRITEQYRLYLKGIKGVRYLEDIPGVKHNYGYFPIIIDPVEFGLNRDQVAQVLCRCNIIPRKYFYPLCSFFDCYSSLPSAKRELLPIASKISVQVLCLPLYGELHGQVVNNISELLRFLNGNSHLWQVP